MLALLGVKDGEFQTRSVSQAFNVSVFTSPFLEGKKGGRVWQQLWVVFFRK